MPQYQTFPDAHGHSDSQAKLECLRLPESLEGSSVLDIACNEGFFCQEAWRRGAARVVGIDKHSEFIERARQRDTRTEYHVMDWSGLREIGEQFDLILLLSALHYADKPRRLLRDAFELLSPHGMLVVEGGIAPGAERKFVRVRRPRGDVVLHPTRSMMMNAVPGAVTRELGPSIEQPGDPIERFAFRITRVKPMFVLVSGRPGSGKSTLARALGSSEDAVVVSLDHLLWTLPEWCTDERLLELRGSRPFRANEIGAIADLISEAGAERAFAEAVLGNPQAFPPERNRHVTIIEGYVLSCGAVGEAFSELLTARGAYVWRTEPAPHRPKLLQRVA